MENKKYVWRGVHQGAHLLHEEKTGFKLVFLIAKISKTDFDYHYSFVVRKQTHFDCHSLRRMNLIQAESGFHDDNWVLQ